LLDLGPKSQVIFEGRQAAIPDGVVQLRRSGKHDHIVARHQGLMDGFIEAPALAAAIVGGTTHVDVVGNHHAVKT